METYIEYMKNHNIKNILSHIVFVTSGHPILEEYLKIYLQTDKGKQEINLQDSDGCTSLMKASMTSNRWSSIETVKLLIENGANVNMQDNNGETALMKASLFSKEYSSIETVKLLIESGANINLQDYNGDTALMKTFQFSREFILIETVKLLMGKDANINLQDISGNTVLIYACKNPIDIEILKYILEKI